jgi:alpha-tubulin suppressor-like RCC1 family protein
MRPTEVSGIDDVASVSCGQRHTCALRRSGDVQCWGLNSAGQLGDGTTINHGMPVQVKGLPPAIAIETGFESTCAIAKTGELWCWGSNGSGQLGDGTSAGSRAPKQVGLSHVVGIAASPGSNSPCAMKNDGTVWCWGNDPGGSKPVAVPGIEAASMLSAGCALAKGNAWCWGWNEQGAVGDGKPQAADVKPTAVLDSVLSVSSSGLNACAVKEDHSLWCWGTNMNGQLGTGDNRDRHTPTQVHLGPE